MVNNIRKYEDLRILPDLALINLAADCFSAINNNYYIDNNYFEYIVLELNKRNRDFVKFAHRKSFNLEANEDFKKELKFFYSSNDYEILEDYVFPEDDILLVRVNGDSMVNAEINNSEILAIELRNELSDGEIGVFEIDGLRFVKRFQIDNHKRLLVSCNPNYPNFEIDNIENFKIIGKVIKTIRDTYGN